MAYRRTYSPIQGESPTGFYGYSGMPLTADDVKNLEAKGVKFIPHDQGGDLLPDGKRLKPPRLRSDVKARRQELGLTKRCVPYMSMAEFDDNWQKWLNEYKALPEPRPPFNRWFVDNHSELVSQVLLRNMFVGNNRQHVGNAVRTFLEHSLSKPKQIVAIEPETAPPPAVEPMKLLEHAISMMSPAEREATLKGLLENA